MTALQKVNLGTAPAGTDGDTVRVAMTKANANVDVLNTQAALTSVASITQAQALTVAHIGKRVNINLASAGTINFPPASAGAADSVILLRNLGTTVVTLSITTGSGDSAVPVSKLNPGEALLSDTDGVHTWSALMRGRTNADAETFNARPNFAGNTPWDSGNLANPVTVDGAQTITGAKTFSVRPTFGSNTPWDSGNLTPSNYMPKSGGAFSGAIAAANILPSGSVGDWRMMYGPGNGIGFRVGTSSAAQYFNLQDNGRGVAIAWDATSDARLKRDVVTIGGALDKVLKMRGVFFAFKSAPSRRHVGVIAQEVQEVFPELVSTVSAQTDDAGKEVVPEHLSVSYGPIGAVLIEAFKELYGMHCAALARIAALECK